MMEFFKKHEKIVLYLNIFFLFIAYLIIVQSSKYGVLLKDDYAISFLDAPFKLPNELIESLFNCLIPNAFNINPNDARAGFGISNILLSFLYLGICYLFAFSFFLFDGTKNILAKKEFLIIFPVSFLLISIPVCNIDNLEIFFRMWDLSSASNYFFSMIPFLLFVLVLYNIVLKNYKPDSICMYFMFVISFLLGSYNEFINLLTLFFVCIFSLFLLVFDRQKLKNKHILKLLIPFSLGLINYYFVLHNIEIFSGLNTDLNMFLHSMFEIIIIQKLFFIYSLIFLIIVLFMKKNKEINNSLFFVFSLFFSYIFANIISIYIIGIDDICFFKNTYIDSFYIDILCFCLSFLIGIKYSLKENQKPIMISFSVILLILISLTVQNWSKMQDCRFKLKSQVYYIDKINLAFSAFGAMSVTPLSYLNGDIVENNIFPMNPMYEFCSNDNIKLFYKDKYFTRSYYMDYYGRYFSKIYEMPFQGTRFRVDNIAYEEIDETLKLFDDKLETIEELKKTNISFDNIYKKYKGRILSIKDLEEMEKKYGKNLVITKSKALAYFHESMYDESIKLYKEYLKYKPEDGKALLNLAAEYTAISDFDNAKKIYKQLMKLDPDNLVFKYQYLDIIYFYDNNYEDAIDLCNQMIALENKMGSNYINKAQILLSMNNKEEALKAFETAENLRSDDYYIFLEENNISDIQKYVSEYDNKEENKLHIRKPVF